MVPSQFARACSGPVSAVPAVASDPAAASSRVSRSSAPAERVRGGVLGAAAAVPWGVSGLRTRFGGGAGVRGLTRLAGAGGGLAHVFYGDQDALLAAADVLVASDVVDDTAGLIADVEGHPALPGGPYCCHGGGGSGRSRSTRLRREVATTCSAIPMMNITMPITAT